MSRYAVGKEPKCPLKLPGCLGIISERSARQCANCYQNARRVPAPPLVDAPKLLAADREKQRLTGELNLLKLKYKEAQSTIAQQEAELHATNILAQGEAPYTIKPVKSEGDAEGTVVLVASDWHVEEEVKPGQVSGMNEFNMDIAHERAAKFFRASLRLIRLLQQDIRIDQAVIGLLGDFISNDIHDEFPEINQLTPTHAIVAAQNMLISGIEFLLNNSQLDLHFVCHSGNHARTTKTVRFATENGHSLEYLMYLHLAAYFKDERRVSFNIPDGYHSYVQVYDKLLRFHHGHAINYAGGVGGIFIPAFKAISQWDKMKQADLDIFGHFHQHKDGGKFVSNGSLIGFNTYALSIKADYERPKQTLLLLDKKRGRTCTWPILFTK
jgi:hypothetical protein